MYEVIDKCKIYKPLVVEELRSPITVTWNIEDEKILKECLDEGAKIGLHEFKGHRAIGGLRASLFCPIPDESAYRLADFLEDFAQKYE
jgi:phosphoserine aminotransferase